MKIEWIASKKTHFFSYSFFLLFSVLFVSGCSSKEQEQVELMQARQAQFEFEELATVIAGGTFLAEKCQEPNMITGAALQARVVEVAALKGLNVEALIDPNSEQSAQLSRVSRVYYQQIIQDPNSTLPYNLRKNCFKLKQMISPFL
ncbi:hypothetical protein [Thorsellia kenyensis]|uniref:Lipoprotein n=1 Tax=Thorsellia kenyensis TaxID=1549888 RepID=A0ABV6CCK2_9GAMM